MIFKQPIKLFAAILPLCQVHHTMQTRMQTSGDFPCSGGVIREIRVFE